MNTQKILNFNFVNETNEDFHKFLNKRIQEKKNTFIVTANPEIITYAIDHKDFGNLIKKADYITPDGIGIVIASKKLNTPLKERITGFDTFTYLIDLANKKSLKVLFYGAKPQIIDKLTTRVEKDYPNIKVVGAFDGYQKEITKIKEKITETQPDLIFVALGSPKQEEFINDNLQLSNSIWMGIGGSFDVFSGETKRAPELFQKLNLEWFYRLVSDPSRFKRYFAIPRFFKLVKQSKKDSRLP